MSFAFGARVAAGDCTVTGIPCVRAEIRRQSPQSHPRARSAWQVCNAMADLQCHGLDLFGALTCERSLVRIVDEARTLKGAAGTAGLCRLSVLAATLEHTAASLTPTAY